MEPGATALFEIGSGAQKKLYRWPCSMAISGWSSGT